MRTRPPQWVSRCTNGAILRLAFFVVCSRRRKQISKKLSWNIQHSIIAITFYKTNRFYRRNWYFTPFHRNWSFTPFHRNWSFTPFHSIHVDRILWTHNYGFQKTVLYFPWQCLCWHTEPETHTCTSLVSQISPDMSKVTYMYHYQSDLSKVTHKIIPVCQSKMTQGRDNELYPPTHPSFFFVFFFLF